MNNKPDKQTQIQTMKPEHKLLYIFTRTPLHIGAGASVGAIDQPIIRERHTGFPIIPATSLKGTFSDCWNERAKEKRRKNGQEEEVEVIRRSAEGCWLFGEPDSDNAAAGALQFTEARLLAFPVRSARGSFAWITCPLILVRAVRDGVFDREIVEVVRQLKEPEDEQAIFSPGKIDLDAFHGGPAVRHVVLEEYVFTGTNFDKTAMIENALARLLEDEVWAEINKRLVILSDGMMSFFARNACDVAQHVRIDDQTGAAAKHALFNQENVPSETLFYSVLSATVGRAAAYKTKTAKDALDEFEKKVQGRPFQFGGDASTGLGWCTVKVADAREDQTASLK